MKIVVIGIAVLGMTLTACSQDIAQSKVPSVVTNALQSKFSAATKIDWEKKKGVYEAEFHQDSLEYTVEIDGTGNITRQKLDITVQQLPTNIAQAISSQYRDFTIEDAEKVEVNGTTYYQVELDAPRGKKDVQLVFDAAGTAAKNAFWD